MYGEIKRLSGKKYPIQIGNLIGSQEMYVYEFRKLNRPLAMELASKNLPEALNKTKFDSFAIRRNKLNCARCKFKD